MFCAECGNQLPAGTTACVTCGTRAEAAPTPLPNELGRKIRARSQDALKAFKTIALNPVGGLAAAFQPLERRQAMEVGVVFATVFEICTVIGLYLTLPRWGGGPGLVDILKLLILGVVPVATIAGASSLARRVFQGQSGNLEGDIFIAGISVLPFGFVALIAGLLGVGNLEVIAITSVFALSYTILILYAGCTRISGISEVGAAPAVPIIISIAGWLSKVIFASAF